MPRWVARGLQFLFALIIAAVYGHRIDADRRAGTRQSPEWVFGVAVAGLSCITAVTFALIAPLSLVSAKFRTYRLYAWDLSLFLLWIVVFGIFAGIFLKRPDDDDYKGASTAPMKAMVWLDLVNALFWLFTGAYGGIKTCLGNKVDGVGGRITGKLFGRKKRPDQHEQWYQGSPA